MHFHFKFGNDAIEQCEWLHIVESNQEDQECKHENISTCTPERINELAALLSFPLTEIAIATPTANQPTIYDDIPTVQHDQNEASYDQGAHIVQPIEENQGNASIAHAELISKVRPTRKSTKKLN